MKRLTVIVLMCFLLCIPSRADLALRGLGALPSCITSYAAEAPAGKLPARVDFSAGLPPTIDQGFQQSCAFWATAYYYGALAFGVPLSPTSLAANISACRHDYACAMPMSAVMAGMLRGVASLAECPAEPWACAAPGGTYRAVAYSALQPDVNALRAHLAGGDAAVVVVPVDASWCSGWWRHGLTIVPNRSQVFGWHAVTVVGYDDARQAFRFVNSWGQQWGTGGLAWMSYSYVDTVPCEVWTMQVARPQMVRRER